MDEFNWLSIIVTARWSLISLSFLLKISCQCRELNDLWFHSTNKQTDISSYTCCGGLCFNPWCKWSMWDGRAQHGTRGWHLVSVDTPGDMETLTLTPALITLWRQTDRDRLMWYLGGISAKLGHAKWRSRGLFSFNFNLHLVENPIKVLPLFDEQTTLQFGDLQTFLKGFL